MKAFPGGVALLCLGFAFAGCGDGGPALAELPVHAPDAATDVLPAEDAPNPSDPAGDTHLQDVSADPGTNDDLPNPDLPPDPAGDAAHPDAATPDDGPSDPGGADFAADPGAALPPNVAAIDQALDPSFLEPSLGLTLKIVAPLLPGYPAAGPGPDDTAWILSAAVTLPTGRTVPIADRETGLALRYPIEGYDDAWLLINASGVDEARGEAWTLNLYPTFSTLHWMKDAGIPEIGADFAPFVVYRSAMFRGVWVTCPAMIGDQPFLSRMRVHFQEDTLQDGRPIGLMLNARVTDDRDAIARHFGIGAFHEACSCVESVGFRQEERPCTAMDVDQIPAAARAVTPPDGSEGVQPGTTLRWTVPADPDGGDVAWELWFGTSRDALDFIASGISEPAHTPALVADATWYWRVDVRDDEGNVVRGPIWTFDTRTSTPVLPPHNYLVLVDRRLEGLLDAELARYLADVRAADPTLVPAVRYWLPGDHVMMRRILVDSRADGCVAPGDCLRGAFLVGDLPSAWYEQDSDFGGDIGVMHEEFPIELYFQDLDNAWRDDDGDGILDGHSDLALEIFTSRLIGGADRIRTYFQRLHDYRANGSFFQPRTFFSFVDDDWNGVRSQGTPDPYTTNQTWGLESVYGDNYLRREWSDDTDKSDYLDVMTHDGAEFVYQWIHSDPQRIFFDDNFSPNPANILSIDELVALDVRGSFFNLFDCSISRYTEPLGNIATEYVHSRFGLAAVGSTKTGGIFNPEVLHQAMRSGRGVGEALRRWFDDTWKYRDAYGLPDPTFDDWWLGMMVQGDPQVTLVPGAPVPAAAPLPDLPTTRRTWSPDALRSLYLTLGRRAQSVQVHGHRDYLRGR